MTFEGYVIQRTAKAFLFWGHFWHAPLWFPASQAELEPDGGSYVMKLREWLAKQDNLEEFTEYTETDIEERTWDGTT